MQEQSNVPGKPESPSGDNQGLVETVTTRHEVLSTMGRVVGTPNQVEVSDALWRGTNQENGLTLEQAARNTFDFVVNYMPQHHSYLLRNIWRKGTGGDEIDH